MNEKGLLLVAGDHLPAACGKGSTDEGTYDEDPEVGESLTTLEQGGTDAAGGIHARAGVMDADQMNQDEGEADGQTCEVVGGTIGLRGGAEDDEHEDVRQHNLNYQAVDGTVGAGVGTRSRGDDDGGIHTDNAVEDSSCEDGTDDLSTDVTARVLGRDAAVEEDAQGDGGIDVAAADAADGVGHGDDAETEGDGCAHDRSGVDAATETHGRAATKQCQHESAYHFSKILFHVCYDFEG